MDNDSGSRFRNLHRPGKPFILANVWDAGSARMLESLGAEAIGTSSAAHAFTLGRPDMGRVTRDEALTHASSLVAAVSIPVSGDFVLVARADGVMNGQYDLDEALARLAGYEAAGADCVYVPLPGTLDDQARICAATTLPVNALAAGSFTQHTRAQFAAAGVARISLGSALARATHRLINDAAGAMFQQGDFSMLSQSISGEVVDALLSR